MKEAGSQKSPTLYDALVTYAESDFYPCHMPGHKRKNKDDVLSNVFQIDITEIDGFDNLHQPEGLIRQAQERAARLYGAEESFFLVNGSTCGILAAICCVTKKQDEILIARNCHKSVYHAAFLQELRLRYLYPEQIAGYDIADAISPQEVEKALCRYPNCKAVVITSPTYEGIVSDIGRISEIVHRKGKILIVDEAHGAHFGLAEGFPENAVRQGADLVIHSLHKTLPSMTQTALLHVNGTLVSRKMLRRYLGIFQTSSPSYVLMASMDACLAELEKNAAFLFEKMRINYNEFKNKMSKCAHLRLGSYQEVQQGNYHLTAWDFGKLAISVKDTSINGQELYDVLKDEFHLQMEMAADSYVLAMMTVADEEDDWQRLADALLQIDGKIEKANVNVPNNGHLENNVPEIRKLELPLAKLTISQAFHADGKEVFLSKAQGEVIGDFINLYPPGIPILVPGEVIEEANIQQIQSSLDLGLRVQGVSDRGTVWVLQEKGKVYH